jgi:hypothetical protein
MTKQVMNDIDIHQITFKIHLRFCAISLGIQGQGGNWQLAK